MIVELEPVISWSVACTHACSHTHISTGHYHNSLQSKMTFDTHHVFIELFVYLFVLPRVELNSRIRETMPTFQRVGVLLTHDESQQ